MGRDYRIIDADQHVVEPPDLWQRWLPEEFQARAPKLVKDEDGGDAWQLGEHTEPLGLVTCVGTHPRDLRWYGTRYDTMDPGCYEPKRRLELMDRDGIDATVIFPPQRTMHYFMGDTDAAFHTAGIRAYNDWVLRDFCGHRPDRLGAICQIPSLGVKPAIEELERLAKAGARGVSISAWPTGGPSLTREDDPFWAAAEELRMPIHLHIALGVAGAKPRQVAVERGGATWLTNLATTLSAMPRIIAETIFSGIFERFPGLRFVGAEVGAGWVPYLLGEMDDRYRRNRHWTEVSLERLPSDYFRSNWLVGFVRDPYGIQNRDSVGVENMLWASDFPHHINDWPNSRWLIKEMSQGVPEADARKIFCENAGRLYQFIQTPV